MDERCDMKLDETDPAVWQKLEAATKDYIENNWEYFNRAWFKPLQIMKLRNKKKETLDLCLVGSVQDDGTGLLCCLF